MNESTGLDKPGLRERKKQRTESDIRANAIELFCKQGVRGATLAEVARSSSVSPATLFNYFPTKGALAEAWVRGEIDSALAMIADQFGEHGIRSTLRKLCRALAAVTAQQSAVRLEAWCETGRAARTPVGNRHPLVVHLRREQERERVRRDVPALTQAEMLVDAIEGALITSLREARPQAEVAKALQARVDLILDGARKKNERVSARSRA